MGKGICNDDIQKERLRSSVLKRERNAEEFDDRIEVQKRVDVS